MRHNQQFHMLSAPPPEVVVVEVEAVVDEVAVEEAEEAKIKTPPPLKTKGNLNGQPPSILTVPQLMHVLTIILMAVKLFIVLTLWSVAGHTSLHILVKSLCPNDLLVSLMLPIQK